MIRKAIFFFSKSTIYYMELVGRLSFQGTSFTFFQKDYQFIMQGSVAVHSSYAKYLLE